MSFFVPLLPPSLLLAAVGAALALALLPGAGRWLRLLAALAFILCLAGPRLPIGAGGEVTVLVDRSPSAQAATAQALPALLARLERNGYAPRVVGGPAEALATDTRLAPALAALPGPVVVLTDGHIHDAPPGAARGPVTIALAAPPRAQDVRLEVIKAPPARAPVGSRPEIRFRATGPVVLEPLGGGAAQEAVASPLRLPPLKPGANGWVLSVRGGGGRPARASFVVEGARERASVLLLTGRAHPGARAWREALRADPALDVTQFVLLRTPDQARAARAGGEDLSALALSSVPAERLFRAGGLAGFDLVVLDDWGAKAAEVLPRGAAARLAGFVEGGGGLIVVGDAPGPLTPLLPAAPAMGPPVPGPVLPRAARAHPVLAPLGAEWGPWLSHQSLKARPGARVLLEAPGGGAPLLLLATYGQGRVVQVGSDGAWAWARGHTGGGPFDALAQRLAGWALANPALDEGALTATHAGAGGEIIVTGGPPGAAIEAIAPDGERHTIGKIPPPLFRADSAGLWAFTAPGAPGPAFAVIGAADPPEWRALAPRLPPEDWIQFAERSGGRVTWPGRGDTLFAQTWSAARSAPPPPALALLIIAALLAAAWWVEIRPLARRGKTA